MKFSIWRTLFFCSVAFVLGFVIATRSIIKDLPPTVEVSIATVKVKGRGNTIESVINTEDVSSENTETETTSKTRNKKNRIRRRDR